MGQCRKFGNEGIGVEINERRKRERESGKKIGGEFQKTTQKRESEGRERERELGK